MKKLFFLLIYIFFIILKQNVYADSVLSSITWTSSSWIKECPTALSHWLTHYWVPNPNVLSSPSSWTAYCLNHNYTSWTEYTKTFTANVWVTYCDAWDRIISISPSNCTSWTCTITCKKFNDVVPIVTATNSSSSWYTADINITLNVEKNIWWNDLVEARYSWTSWDLWAACTTWWTNYVNWQSIIDSTDWSRILYLCARDIIWNVWTWTGTYKLDKIKPIVSSTNWSSTIWKKADISISLWVSDSISWIWEARYSWMSDDLWTNCTTGGTSYSNWQVITNSTSWNRILYLCSKDIAWNVQHFTVTYMLDKTLPIVSASDSSSTIWKNNDIAISLSVSDTISATEARYSWTSWALAADCISWWTIYTNWQIITDSTEWIRTLYLCARDEAWNVSTWSWTYKLDKTFPIISATNSSDSIINSNNIFILLTLKIWDTWLSNLIEWRYTWTDWNLSSDCKSWWIVYLDNRRILDSTNWTRKLYLCARDERWNVSTWNWTYIIDKASTWSEIVTSTWTTESKKKIIYQELLPSYDWWSIRNK